MQRIAFAIAVIFSVSIASPVLADGEIVITQAKALAGNVTPGDTAGFPVTLSQPGAYILGSNLTVPGYTYGIIATTNNVDIDLKGFRLAGNNFGTYGVVSNYGESRIHGGVINTFRNAGIYIRSNAWTIEDMQIVRNAGSGIDATGVRSVLVRNSYIASNGYYGLIVGTEGLVEGNRIFSNGIYGVMCYDGCHVSHNNISSNSQMGVFALSGTVDNNVLSENRGYGIYDNEPVGDLAVFENTLLRNNLSGSEAGQIRESVRVYGNTCIGKPC